MWLNSFCCTFMSRWLSSAKNKMFLRWTHFSSSNLCRQIHLPVDANVQIQFSVASAASLYERKPLKCWVSGVPFHLSSEKLQFTCIYIRQLTWEDPSWLRFYTSLPFIYFVRSNFFLNTHLSMTFLLTGEFFPTQIMLIMLTTLVNQPFSPFLYLLPDKKREK